MKSDQPTIDKLFVKKEEASEGDCYRCGKCLRYTRPSPESLKWFKKMTGLVFPHPSILLNVEVDAKSLGASAPVVGRGSFCGDCAVAYMKEFNRLNQMLRAN